MADSGVEVTTFTDHTLGTRQRTDVPHFYIGNYDHVAAVLKVVRAHKTLTYMSYQQQKFSHLLDPSQGTNRSCSAPC